MEVGRLLGRGGEVMARVGGGTTCGRCRGLVGISVSRGQGYGLVGKEEVEESGWKPESRARHWIMEVRVEQ